MVVNNLFFCMLPESTREALLSAAIESMKRAGLACDEIAEAVVSLQEYRVWCFENCVNFKLDNFGNVVFCEPIAIN